MRDWIQCKDERPELGDHVIICFWWPEGETYNMALGTWPYTFEDNGWGVGCLPVQWMPAPEYPEMLP